jgi:hypothetical protein
MALGMYREVSLFYRASFIVHSFFLLFFFFPLICYLHMDSRSCVFTYPGRTAFSESRYVFLGECYQADQLVIFDFVRPLVCFLFLLSSRQKSI